MACAIRLRRVRPMKIDMGSIASLRYAWSLVEFPPGRELTSLAPKARFRRICIGHITATDSWQRDG